MRLRVGARTDKGQVRSLNEDACVCETPLGLFVVCDGMGGEAAGEVASRMAIETLLSQLNGSDDWPRDPQDSVAAGFRPPTRQLAAAVQLANRAVFDESRRNTERAGMGTTVVAAWLHDNLASLAHVGDSRAYLWRNGQLEQLTLDHSLVEEQVRAGLLTREQSLAGGPRNVLLRALGREATVEVELAEVPLMPGDYLLLCSDGLTGMVADEEITARVARLRHPQEISSSLVSLANQNGGADNITVVVVQVLPDPFWRRLWRFGRR